MKKLLILFLAVSGGLALNAQQDPLYSNYRFNTFFLNPAVAGSEGQWTARTSYRSEWTRMPGAPITAGASFHGMLGNRVGGGINIVNDKAGLFRFTGFQMAYAYHIPLENANLSFGLAGRAINGQLDQMEASPLSPNDPSIAGFASEWLADFAFGVHLYGERFFAGISAPQVFQLSGDEHFVLARHFYGMGGYRFDANKFSIEPMAFLKFVPDGGIFQADINLRGHFIERQLMFGVGYRTGMNFLALMGGFNVQDSYQFSYSYDFALGNADIPWQSYTWGGHEVTMGIKFGKQKIDFLRKDGSPSTKPVKQEEMPTEE